METTKVTTVILKPATSECNNFILKVDNENIAILHTKDDVISQARTYATKMKKDIYIYEYLGKVELED